MTFTVKPGTWVAMRRLIVGLLAMLSLTQGIAQAQTCPGTRWEFAPPPASATAGAAFKDLRRLLESLQTTSLVVAQNGRIVFEYGNVTQPVNIKSARKSLLSILYGIAVDRGQARLDATVGQLGLDDRQGLSELEKSATLKHLLQARSCIHHPAEYETDGMKAKRPPRNSCQPGERWYYNNWDFNALGTAYRTLTDRTVFEGLEEELAKPLGFENFNPASDTQFVSGTASHHPAYVMRLSARDLARVGVLMARHGNWCGRQIVSPSWVAESTATISATDRGSVKYGHLWWTSQDGEQFGQALPGRVSSARGHLGQYLLVVPEADLVISHLTDEGQQKPRQKVSSADFGRIVNAVLAALTRP